MTLKVNKFGTIFQREDGKLQFDGFAFSCGLQDFPDGNVPGEAAISAVINFIADSNGIPVTDMPYDKESEIVVIRALRRISDA